jgi:hypothetical protein
MTRVRLAVFALLLGALGSAYAVELPKDPEKLRADFVKLSNENAELKRQVAQLSATTEKCQHIMDQIARGAKDD